MKVDIPTPPDLPQWFSMFRSEYANTVDGVYGSVTANSEGFDAYVVLSRNLERFEGQFPTAAEAVQAIVDYVAANAKSGASHA